VAGRQLSRQAYKSVGVYGGKFEHTSQHSPAEDDEDHRRLQCTLLTFQCEASDRPAAVPTRSVLCSVAPGILLVTQQFGLR
jgi:hypothetical protein